MAFRHRVIKGLKWVEDPATNYEPDGWPPPRKSKARYVKAGLLFQDQVSRYMVARYGARVLVGPWIRFEDENGPGLAQPDIIFSRADQLGIVVIECKLSYTPRKAKSQVMDLYVPLLEHLYLGEPISGVQVCRRLTRSAKKDKNLLSSLDEVLSGEVDSGFYSVKFEPPPTSRRSK